MSNRLGEIVLCDDCDAEVRSKLVKDGDALEVALACECSVFRGVQELPNTYKEHLPDKWYNDD